MTKEEKFALKRRLRERYSADRKRVYEIAVEEIDRMKTTESRGEWIPVTERLPENSDSVLATTRWGELTIAEKLDIGPDCWFIYEGNANAHTEDIVAWQPLPEPYKAERR